MRNKKLKIVLFALIALTFVTVLFIVNTTASSVQCNNISIKIDTTAGLQFINEEDIKEILINKEKFRKGMQISLLNLEDLENTILNHPSVKSAEVFSNVTGDLMVEVEQRRPVLRVKNFWGESYYIDADGKMMPLSSKFSCRIPVASGLIVEHFNPEFQIVLTENDSLLQEGLLTQCFRLAMFLDKNPFWKYQTDQIFVNYKKEIELIPRVGDHLIMLGDASELNKKFDRLMTFYQFGLKNYSWDRYSQIDVRFANQIVCKKKNK